MSIIGCDLHSRYQQIAVLEMETGEIVTRRREHENGEAKAFYARLPKPSLIGIGAIGYTQWFERMLAEIGQGWWMGDPAEIRARSVRRQVTETRAAEHLLDLLLTKRFPRVGVLLRTKLRSTNCASSQLDCWSAPSGAHGLLLLQR